jgi:transcriptional regulator with XRE-family HTH domain
MANTKDALKIIDQMVGDDAELRQMIAEENVNATVAQMIYEARTDAGFTQEKLADLVGTKQPVIARLEDAEYEGHSLTMLNRIAKALNRRLRVEMKEAQPAKKAREETVRLCSYVVENDTGFAPNPFWGFCTCAACSPNHLNYLLVPGDWLMGNTSAGRGNQRRLIYAMRISERPMHFDDYYRDRRFARKKARDGTWKDRCGDNIYFRDEAGRWIQTHDFHHNAKNIKQDTRNLGHVFISDYFFYFGEQAPVIPIEYSSLVRIGRRTSPYHTGATVQAFIDWLEREYPAGQYDRRQYIGLPRDREEEASAGGGPGCTSAATGITSECSKPRTADARPHVTDRKRS